jgi:WD40 repeat protein
MILPIVLLSLLAAESAPIVAVSFTPDAKQVLAGSQAGVQVFSCPTVEPVGRVATKLEQVHDVSFAPGGKQLAIAGGSPGERGAVEIWNWPEAKLLRSLPAGDDVVYRTAWNGDGSKLALACADKVVRLRPADGSAPKLCPVHSAAVLSAAWLAADDLVLSAGVDQSIRLLSPKSGEVIRTFDNHTAAVRDLAIRPGTHEGPQMVASAGADRTVRFWQPTIGRLVRFVRLPVAPTAICWTPDGSHALAACEDGRVRVVDPATVAVTEIDGTSGWCYAIAASPDGKYAVIGGERGELRKVALDAIVGNALRGVP